MEPIEQENRGRRRKSKPILPAQELPAGEEPQKPKRPRPRARLRWRWLLNTLAITFLVVSVAVTAFSLAMYSYYRSAMQAALEGKAQTAAGMFRNYTQTTYLFTARQFINQFEEKSTIEAQILSAGGGVLMSSIHGVQIVGHRGDNGIHLSGIDHLFPVVKKRDIRIAGGILCFLFGVDIAESAQNHIVGLVCLESSLRLVVHQDPCVKSALNAKANNTKFDVFHFLCPFQLMIRFA